MGGICNYVYIRELYAILAGLCNNLNYVSEVCMMVLLVSKEIRRPARLIIAVDFVFLSGFYLSYLLAVALGTSLCVLLHAVHV